METQNTNYPRVVVPPPVIIGLPFAAGMLLQWLVPIRFPPRAAGLVLGVPCGLFAIVLWVKAYTAFRRAGTSMLHSRRSRALIVNGPFAYTRNPLYLSLVLFYAGFSLGVSVAWCMFLLPIAVLGLHFLAILPEEWYLEGKYGDEYRTYKARVRRWL
jgi:protein-S-isoprenylcysteine O-methyltransferase Ste14